MRSSRIPPYSNGRSYAGLRCKRISSAAQSAAVLAPRIGRQNVEEIGAGEGIRTLDPDLGKVMVPPLIRLFCHRFFLAAWPTAHALPNHFNFCIARVRCAALTVAYRST